MLRFAVLALLVAAASATAVVPTITRVDPIVKSAVAPFGIVEGIVCCGSRGQMLETRVTDCTTLPCDLTVGKTYFVELDFVAFANHPFLTVTVSIIVNNEETIIINRDVAQSVVAGVSYTVAYPISITGAYALGNVALRIQVAGDGTIELCGLASALIHP